MLGLLVLGRVFEVILLYTSNVSSFYSKVWVRDVFLCTSHLANNFITPAIYL